jgi:Fe-S oxidoreductase/nitrate reductase gamma subunit
MPPLSEATRPLMWNVPASWVMYLLFVVAVAIFGWGAYQRVQFWRKGKEDGERLGDWGKRLNILLRETLLQTRVRNSTVPALFHSLIFYSFAVLFVTTLVVMVQYDGDRFLGMKINVFTGFLYVLLSVASELAGLLILIGLGIAAYRRFVAKPETLSKAPGDAVALLLLAGIVVTGYFTEGLRIAILGDPWQALSPVGWASGALFAGIGRDNGSTVHASMWWAHAVFALGWIALIPYTKFVHLLSLPTNVFFSKLAPRGALRHPDLEKMMESADSEAELSIGIQKAGDLTWKQRLDADSCISCGRCEEVCPGYMSFKGYFTPRQFLDRLKTAVHANGGHNGNGGAPAIAADLVGNAFDEEFIWQCRTCTACMEVCPALIEHVDTLIEVRRNEVLMQGRMPADAARALRQLETYGNPFGSQSDRVDWIAQMKVKVVGPGDKVDVLYWIGCCATFDPEKQKIARDLCALLDRCGVDFGVLGGDEKCCGDPARVIGHEMLFQQIAREQIELLKQREFKVLLTSCPHCYNVLAHEYRQLGAEFNVVHHSEFLHEMLWVEELVPVAGEERKCVYHDPCYLGRYQKIYDSPREVIKAIPGAQVLEMKNHHGRSLCCGGGGGHYWMDLKKGERINNLRVKQALDAGADTIVTGCAYCLHMLQDSLKLLDRDDVQVVDVGSLLLSSLDEPRKHRARA